MRIVCQISAMDVNDSDNYLAVTFKNVDRSTDEFIEFCRYHETCKTSMTLTLSLDPND